MLPASNCANATPILGSADLAPWAEHDQPDVAAARRARFLDVAARAGVDGWSLRTPEAARAAGVEPVAHADVDALPDSGRVAVDRISLDELTALRAAHPHLEWVDAGPLVAAAALPRSTAELAVMREGSARASARCATRSAHRGRDDGARAPHAVLREAARGGRAPLGPHRPHLAGDPTR